MGKKTTHSTNQCRTLKKEAEKHKKTCKNGNRKTSKPRYHPTKEDIHALATFFKDVMKKDIDKELANFKNMSMSGDKEDKK